MRGMCYEIDVRNSSGRDGEEEESRNNSYGEKSDVERCQWQPCMRSGGNRSYLTGCDEKRFSLLVPRALLEHCIFFEFERKRNFRPNISPRSTPKENFPRGLRMKTKPVIG